MQVDEVRTHLQEVRLFSCPNNLIKRCVRLIYLPVAPMLDPTDKYKLEYAEVGNLRRHYSVVRSGLTTFCLTASLAAHASYISQEARPPFLEFVAIFMLVAALIACGVFSYRCERANLYLRELWRWLEGTSQNAPPRFDDFKAARREVLREMLWDSMNWALIAALLSIVGFVFFRWLYTSSKFDDCCR
jgi:hypothetical protein